MSYPFFKLLSVDNYKISDELGKDKAIVKFAPLKTLRAWEARANGIYAGSGLLLGKSDHLFPSSYTFPSSNTYPRSFIHLAENVLLYSSVDGAGWSKGYNTNIVYTQDGPDADSPTVATFDDVNGGGSGYWYSYGDYAPQEDGTTYVIGLWVKVQVGYANVQPYTADNSESSRKYGGYQRVDDFEGWKLLTWEITTSDPNNSDSLSFVWNGTWNSAGKMSISAPLMVKKNEIQFEIDDEELQQDDIYRVNLYGVDDKDGEWNPRDLRKVRYIRDWLSGSTANTGNHWYEIQAYIESGVNVALSKTVTASSGGQRLTYITDGNTAGTYAYTTGGSSQWVQVDLGQVYEVNSLKVWHYHNDGRTYYKTKTEVSVDGVNWETVFDSQVSGQYQETSAGKEIKL